MLEIELLEFNIIKICNMNCKGCDHFSTLFNSPGIISVDTFRRDLSRMKELGIEKIKTIGLLGGEPLLVKNLAEYITICKEIYPDSKIEIRTNGILLGKISEELINTLKEYKTKFVISLYPNMRNEKVKMHKFLKKRGISHDFLVFKEQFCKLLSEERNQKELRKYCIAESPTLEDGIMYICPISAYVHKLNERFGFSFPDKEGKDIFAESISGEELYSFMQKPIHLCEYCCREDMSVFKWECNYKQKVNGSDWVMQPDDEKMRDFKNKRVVAYRNAIQKDNRLNRYKSKIYRIIKLFIK